MPDEKARLLVGGAAYEGWTSVKVSRSMAQLAGTFELTVTDKYPGQPQRYAFKLGAPCKVTLRGQTVITGHLEEIAPQFDKEQHQIILRGRDATGDLVDCSHLGPPTQWREQTLLTIAQDLCRPFGITVAAEAEVGAPFADVRTNEGDTVLAFLARLCRQRGLLPLSYGDGRLILAQAASRGGGGRLEQGGNIKAARSELSDRERFSRYLVKAHGDSPAMPDRSLDAKQKEEFRQAYSSYVSPLGEASDPAVGRHRPLVIMAETKATAESAQARADWEAGVRAGRSRRHHVTVQGWGPGESGIWQINRLVGLSAPLLGVDGQFLIEGVDYASDTQNGTTAELHLVHPDAYLAQPAKAGGITGGFDQ